MSKRRRKREQESEAQSKVALQPKKDPTFFLTIWLGVPMALMILYAVYGPH